jgi:hypothetical protein
LRKFNDAKMCFKRCDNGIFSDKIDDYRVNKKLLDSILSMGMTTEDPNREMTIRIAGCPNTIDMDKF